MQISLTVNREARQVTVGGADSLLKILRDELGLPGSKNACEQGECGSCSVIRDGKLVCACLVMAADCEDSNVTTVEGLSVGDDRHPVQEAMLRAGAVQCGFCTPGFVVAAAYYLDRNPDAAADDLREELAGNICRCTGYGSIVRALAGGIG